MYSFSKASVRQELKENIQSKVSPRKLSKQIPVIAHEKAEISA